MSRFVDQLLAEPMLGVIGPNGSGKDLLISRLAAKGLAAGRPLLSNLAVYDPNSGYDQPHPGATLLTSLEQLMTWDGDIWLSEITTVAGSREASALPVQVQARVQQLRKGLNGSRLWWSAPSFQRADRVLRECSVFVVKARGVMREASGENIHRPNRLFRYKAYDARDVEDFNVQRTSVDAAAQHKIRALARDWYYRPAHDHQRLYRTLDQVSTLSFGALTGTCLVCHGKVVQPTCYGHADDGTALDRPRRPRRDTAPLEIATSHP